MLPLRTSHGWFTVEGRPSLQYPLDVGGDAAGTHPAVAGPDQVGDGEFPLRWNGVELRVPASGASRFYGGDTQRDGIGDRPILDEDGGQYD